MNLSERLFAKGESGLRRGAEGAVALLLADHPQSPHFDWSLRREMRLLVTPDLAAAWLILRNGKNRNFNDTHVGRLGSDMRAGRWKFNGDTIRFDGDGLLMDGQHRLKACEETGCSFSVIVVFGLERECMETIDSASMARTPGQQLHLAGIPNANLAAAIAALLIMYEKHGVSKIFTNTYRPTSTEIHERASRDVLDGGEIQRSCFAARKAYKFGVNGRYVGFCSALFARQNQERSDEFFAKLAKPADLSEDNPVFILSERLSANMRAKARLRDQEVMALLFKAWVAWRDDRPVRTLRWRTEGPNPEPFPQI